ncbi:MAG: hypothetical protein IKK66_06375 [Ruminococcus sp.]|nr:hypothetical protein [Ruminococcus sp.]
MKKLLFLLSMSLLLTGCTNDTSASSNETSAETTEYTYDSYIIFSADENADDSTLDKISEILTQRFTNAYSDTTCSVYADYELNTIQIDFNMVMAWHKNTAELLTMPNSLKMYKGDSQDGELIITNEDIASAYFALLSPDNDYIVNLCFEEKGAQAFSDATAELAGTGTPITIWLDDELIYSPVVNAYVSGNETVISGNFTEESAHELAIRMGSAYLPYELSVKEENLAPIT